SVAPPTALSDGSDTWVEAIRRATERIDALTTPGPRALDARPLSASRPDLGAARELLAREQYAEALDRVSALPATAASDPDVLLLRAVLLTHRGQLEDAEAACERLLAIDELNAG